MQNVTAQENSTNIMPPTSITGNNTADKLLTYNSSSYWISIQYPSSWIKEELQNQSSGEIVKFSSLPRNLTYAVTHFRRGENSTTILEE